MSSGGHNEAPANRRHLLPAARPPPVLTITHLWSSSPTAERISLLTLFAAATPVTPVLPGDADFVGSAGGIGLGISARPVCSGRHTRFGDEKSPRIRPAAGAPWLGPDKPETQTASGGLTQAAGLVQPKGAVEGSCLTFAATFIVRPLIDLRCDRGWSCSILYPNSSACASANCTPSKEVTKTECLQTYGRHRIQKLDRNPPLPLPK